MRTPSEWPGVLSSRLAERTVVDKPDLFFDPEGDLPQHATLSITRPPIYPHLDDATLAGHLARAVERHVREARTALATQGRKFLGAKAVLRQPFDAVPKSTEPRRNPSPRIAAKHTPERVQAIQHLLDFIRRYRDAWHAWRAGARDILFPAGTYALRIHARVACAPACPA